MTLWWSSFFQTMIVQSAGAAFVQSAGAAFVQSSGAAFVQSAGAAFVFQWKWTLPCPVSSVQYLCKPKLMHCTEKAFLWVIIFICKGSADRGSERKKPQILIRQNHDLNVIFVLKVFVSLIKQLTFWLNVNCRRASLNDYVQNLPSSRQFFSLLSYWWHKLSTAIKWQ